MRPHPFLILPCLVAATFAAAGASSSGAATTSTIVGATVPSATELDAALCAPNTPATEIGALLPGASATTGTDCTISFGSSNDTSALRIRQRDGTGVAMWRLPTGTLDAGFQGDGIGDAVVAATAPAWARGGHWAVAPDGRTYVAATNGTTSRVARLDAAGALDMGWNGTGVLDIGTTNGGGIVAVRSDGRVYVLARNGLSRLMVFRFLANGTPDPTCNGAGSITVTSPAGYNGNSPSAVVLDEARGRLYVGVAFDNGANNDLGVVALRETDCQPDGTFSGDGQWMQDHGNYEVTTGIAIAGDGDLYVTNDEYAGMRVTRLNVDGTSDGSFNGTGTRVFDPTGSDARSLAVAVDGSGRVVVVGTDEPCGGCDKELIAARLLTNGSFDPTFNGGTPRRLDPTAGDDSASDVLVDPVGNVVLAGSAGTGAAAATVTARVTDAGLPDASFGTNGVRIVDVDAARSDRATRVWERPDGALMTGVTRDLDGTSDRFLPIRFDALPVSDYLDDTRDWLTSGTGHFGACLRATTGAATWSTQASCTTGSDPWWRAVPAAASTVATESTAGPQLAHLRFGMRALAAQPAGRYVAPITFEVVAPAA